MYRTGLSLTLPLQLLGLYIIIALAFYVYPDDATGVPDILSKSARSLVGY